MNTEQMQQFCAGLKGVTEDVKWEDHLCFCVGGKIFCITGFPDDSGASVKVDPDRFDELTEREGITQARYLAKRKWISIEKRSTIKDKEWKELLKAAYELVKLGLTKKLQQEYAD